jgi:uncharacterized damage-inducible protein DinB
MPKVQSIVEEIRKESEATSRMLERVPGDKLDWQPHPKSKSVGDLAYHIAALPALVANVLRRDDFDAAAPRPAMPRDVPPVEVFRRNLDEFLSVIGSMDYDQMMQPFRFHFGDKTLLEGPKAVVVRTLLMNHTYHHRGQLSVYLRLLDVPVPIVYGNTADEKAF